MASQIHEQLLDDPLTQMVSDFDMHDGKFVHVAESNEWVTEQVTQKAALITFLNDGLGNRSEWIPKSVIGFSPSGDLYLKEWFWSKNRP